ncbi:1-deoxy-D-xylulose-5-phosphate synthase [Caproiciproducens galactitolivorans]|uniref:1-deoxy-D-xylulose-5-phosphate synthase n=1 Tax=Caproiciproducens galactitolivorans TaxID=642589 RepID=A0A4Z0YG27_9FIRM|nr:1-deoxy-D-xylulose-5-phosphate synthase [Caproiciproducens galactitolivorans]
MKAAQETGKIITVEEHSVIGGLGEAVCSVVAEEYPIPVMKLGVNDVYGHSGPAADLLDEFGLSTRHIAEAVKKFLKK